MQSILENPGRETNSMPHDRPQYVFVSSFSLKCLLQFLLGLLQGLDSIRQLLHVLPTVFIDEQFDLLQSMQTIGQCSMRD